MLFALIVLATLALGAAALAAFDFLTTRASRRGRLFFSFALMAASFLLALHGDVAMAAVSVTTILAGTNTFIGDVIATADADVTATITHGLSAGGTPLGVTATKILTNALAAEPGWSWAAPGATTCVGTKLATAGSGNAAAQQRVTITTPHTIGR